MNAYKYAAFAMNAREIEKNKSRIKKGSSNMRSKTSTDKHQTNVKKITTENHLKYLISMSCTLFFLLLSFSPESKVMNHNYTKRRRSKKNAYTYR